MASRETNPDRKNKEIITDLPSKIPGKLVSAKRANTGKLISHLVSSTPTNPAKRAKFFDESNIYGSPIRSGGSASDVNANSPDNKTKNLKSDKNIQKTMLDEEQAEGESPFPFVTKLAVKKMTICASDDDSDDNIFAGEKVTKKLLLDTDEDLNFDLPSSRISHIKTKAIVEPARKVTSNEGSNDEVKKNLTKTVQMKLVDVISNENVLKTTRATKSYDDNKENENTDTNIMKTKPKSEVANKSTKKKQTDNDKSNLDISPKQRKLNENTVQKKKMTKTENDISSFKAPNEGSNKNSTLINNTKIKTAKKPKIALEGVRKSTRSCPSTVPFWLASWDPTDSTINVAKRTRSEEIGNNTVILAKDTNRPKTVPESVTKRKEPKRVETKLQSTVTLNRSKTKSEPEPTKNNDKKESNEANALNRSKMKLKINKPEKRNTLKESIEENVKNATINRSGNKLKIKGNEKKSTVTDEVPETTKKSNKSKIKEVEEKEKESQGNVLKSNKNDQDTQVKEVAGSNVQENKKRQYPKETLDKENKKKQSKDENIAAKRRSVSPAKSYSRRSLDQTMESEIQEIDDDLLLTLVQESFRNNKTNSKRKDVRGMSKETFEVLSPSRTSKRISEKTKKGTNKIEYTPGIALKQNKNDAKNTLKRKTTNTENKINEKMENRTLRSKTSSTKNRNKHVDDLEENDLETEDLSDSESSNDNQQRKIRKRRVIDPVNTRRKTSIQRPGLNNKRASKMKNQYNNKSSKQVNFNVNDSEINNSFESDSLSSHENPSKISCKASYNYNKNPPRQFGRSSKDSKYPRKTLFYKHNSVDLDRPQRTSRKPRYISNESTVDESDDSWTSEENYVPRTKRRKYMTKRTNKKRKVAGFLNFKENALKVQVPAVRQTLTEIEQRGRTFMMECFGFFPKTMTKINEQSSLRGTCFMNHWFASGMMEISLGTIKKCNASNNHTYFLILDGMAEVGIAGSVKIMRIGDCFIVPKHTFYYIANASSEVNLLLNFLKISL